MGSFQQQSDDGTSWSELLSGGDVVTEVLHPSPALKLPLLPDTAAFLRRLRTHAESSSSTAPPMPPSWDDHADRVTAAMFSWSDELVVCRAPGRMDVMGGIADYSGALVLQMPIAEACHVALQRRRRVSREQPATITIVSPAVGGDDADRASVFEMPLADLLGTGSGEGGADGTAPLTYAEARVMFAKDAATQWAAYVAGALLVLAREKGVLFNADEDSDSIVILLSSEVPEGKGVSSSAAVEVAAMCAVAAAFGIEFADDPETAAGRELAMLCQKVENLVVGAPCGVMDQMASACGREGCLLSLLCRPAEVKGTLALPPHAAVWGIDSGVRHYVGGSDYGKVRTGAFMGMRIIQEYFEQHGPPMGNDHLEHLTEIAPHVFDSPGFPDKFKAQGGAMAGHVFLSRFPGGHGDDATDVELTEVYDVAAATTHPVYEHHRVRAFAAILGGGGSGRSVFDTDISRHDEEEEQLSVLGELMYQSDASYGRLGLGSDGTDAIVRLVKQLGPSRGLFGAKITGGGCGGTVCVLGRADGSGAEAVEEVCRLYEQSTGRMPYLFQGSSPGAMSFGHIRVRVMP